MAYQILLPAVHRCVPDDQEIVSPEPQEEELSNNVNDSDNAAELMTCRGRSSLRPLRGGRLDGFDPNAL